MPAQGRKGTRRKPKKPYPTFPLYAHAAGVWAKRIHGREHYFGPWHDPDGALERYRREAAYLHDGQAPPPDANAITIDEIVHRFLGSKDAAVEIGEITRRHFADYVREGKRVVGTFGASRPAATLRPEDFGKLRAAISKGTNATTQTNRIVRTRAIFRWAYRAGLLDKPINYGDEFAIPAAKARRKARRANGPRAFTAAELRAILEAATGHANLRAMVLLGINAALGNTDCAELRTDHLDLDGAILDFPRPKTETDRRAALWPETVAAIRAALEARAAMLDGADPPADLAARVFVTKQRRPYVRLNAKGTPIDSIATAFTKVLNATGTHRPGLGFYALRHTFRTVADATKDFPAVDLVMGHTAADVRGAPFAVEMAARYREHIADDRLVAVAEHVRAWLFDGEAEGKP